MKPSGGFFGNHIRWLVATGIIVVVVVGLVWTKPWSAATGSQTPPMPTPASVEAAAAPIFTATPDAVISPQIVFPTIQPTSEPKPSATATSTMPATPTTAKVETPTAKPSATPTLVKTATPPAKPNATAAPTSPPKAAPTATAAGTSAGKRKLVAVDAGHGGEYIGAANGNLAEKNINLRVALLLRDLLKQAGYDVVLTRGSDSKANTAEKDTNGDGEVTVEDDLQARVDIVNNAGADLYVSIHHNGSNTPMRGTMSIYCADRPQAAKSKTLASLLQTNLLAQFRVAGYTPTDLGVRDDANLGKPGGHLVGLGPKQALVARPSNMPGALGEALFVSDATEAALLRDDRFLQAEAAAYRDAVVQFFKTYP